MICLAALWNKKAKEWIRGRKNLFDELQKKISPTDKIIWMHCSSAGEFEQGKPIIEQLKKEYPATQFGFEAEKYLAQLGVYSTDKK